MEILNAVVGQIFDYFTLFQQCDLLDYFVLEIYVKVLGLVIGVFIEFQNVREKLKETFRVNARGILRNIAQVVRFPNDFNAAIFNDFIHLCALTIAPVFCRKIHNNAASFHTGDLLVVDNN